MSIRLINSLCHVLGHLPFTDIRSHCHVYRETFLLNFNFNFFRFSFLAIAPCCCVCAASALQIWLNAMHGDWVAEKFTVMMYCIQLIRLPDHYCSGMHPWIASKRTPDCPVEGH